MKKPIALILFCGSMFFAGCETDLVERRTVVHRSADYRSADPDRVYHRDPYYREGTVVRRSAYHPPRYRTYSSNPLETPAGGDREYERSRRVVIYR